MKGRQVVREVVGIFAVGASFFLLASLLSFDVGDDPSRVFPVRERPSNFGGLTGFWLARGLFDAFGVVGGYLAGALALGVSLAFLTRREPTRDLLQGVVGGFAVIVAVASLERALVGMSVPFVGVMREDLGGRLAGGVWGTFIAHWVQKSFSRPGVFGVIAVGLTTGVALSAEYFGEGWGVALEDPPSEELEERGEASGEESEAPCVRVVSRVAKPPEVEVRVSQGSEDEETVDVPLSSVTLWPVEEVKSERVEEPIEEDEVEESGGVLGGVVRAAVDVAQRAVSVLEDVRGRAEEALLPEVVEELPSLFEGDEEFVGLLEELDFGEESAFEPEAVEQVEASTEELAVAAEESVTVVASGQAEESESVVEAVSRAVVEESKTVALVSQAVAEESQPAVAASQVVVEESRQIEESETEGIEESGSDEEMEVVSGRLCEADLRGLPLDEEELEEDDEEEWLCEDEEEEEEVVHAPYETPSVDLLTEPECVDDSEQRAEVEAKAKLIEECLCEFKVEAKVEHIERGPNVTMYALSLGKGIKVQRISALLDNLALVLAAPGAIRLQAPIRGTSWVGLEVPNEKQEMVSFAEIYRQPGWREESLALPLFLGKDTAGRPLVADLAKLPHLLIAGATGSGKSVCINTMILSLLMTRAPSEVKLILIDPKQVELAPFGEIPHLLSPVVTDMQHAGAALDWAVQKMEERYNYLARARVRHLREYNKLGKEGIARRMKISVEELEEERIPWKLPYVVVVVDELNDLMMVAQKEVEASIMRLAQKSRAVGIHVILATQRPSVDVITGVIKSNLPARLAFQVTSKVDSRTILDVMGAEKLLGMGDMLFLAPGRSQPIRAKGAYVSEEEMERVLETICHQREPQFAADLVALKDAPPPVKKKRRRKRKAAAEPVDAAADELFDEAVETVLSAGRGSVSLLQRKLGVGYARAARLIEAMSEREILGGDRGSKARKVLMTMAEWEAKSG